MKLPELLAEVAELETRTTLRGIEGTAVDARRYEKELMPELAKRLKLAVWTLRKSHCCATLRDDGTCEGCHVSEALREIEDPADR